MPIHELTDHAPALPIIGQLRKGEKKTQADRPGKDLDYFRFTTDDEKAMELFRDNYGERPRRINVLLPAATADECIANNAWMEEWVAGGLVKRCDRREICLWRTPQGNYSTEPKPCEEGRCKCKQVARLPIIIPELGRFATVTVLTTSLHDIMNLTKQLRQYELMSQDLRGIPFVLTRKPHMISTPMPDGKRVRREKWLLDIETNAEWTKRKMLEMQDEAMPELADSDVPLLVEGSAELITELPEGITDPTGEAYDEPDHRPALDPDMLKSKLNTTIEQSKFIDPETGEQMPITMHTFKDDTANLVWTKLVDAMRLSTPADQDKPDTELEGEAKAVLKWLTGKVDVKKLNAPQADALLAWLLNSHKDEGNLAQVADPAPAEARAVFVYTRKK